MEKHNSEKAKRELGQNSIMKKIPNKKIVL
jgi:hypothetical protein